MWPPAARRGTKPKQLIFYLAHLEDAQRMFFLTLLLAEQSIPLALAIADYAYVLQTGRTVLEGTAESLENDAQVQEIYLGIKASATAP